MGRRMQLKYWGVLGGFVLAAVSLLVIVSDFVPGAQADMSAPTLSVAEAVNMPTPLPFPYDESADAMAAVDAALARAEESGKRVLIDLGGNWCGWCRLLAGVMDENGGDKLVHGSGGISQPRAE